MTIRAALINLSTNIVENILVVDTLEDNVPEGFILAPLEMVQEFTSRELSALQEILKAVDPDFKVPETAPIEHPINIGVTKWSEERKYYEE
jgi:hypothetical protein